jgi:hypothetical protein
MPCHVLGKENLDNPLFAVWTNSDLCERFLQGGDADPQTSQLRSIASFSDSLRHDREPLNGFLDTAKFVKDSQQASDGKLFI